MKRIALLATTAIAGYAGAAHAAAVDRSGQSSAILYESGNYFSVAYGHVSPDVSGTQVVSIGPYPKGRKTDDATPSYEQYYLGYKHDFGNGIEAAIIYDEPFGALIDYQDNTGYFAQGAYSTLETRAFTGLVKYTFDSNLSIFGGLRYQTFRAEANIPYVTANIGPLAGAPYVASGDREPGVGWVVGAGYEIPEIAMRVSLTYNSEIDYTIETHESSVLGTSHSDTDVTTPQSLNLEFQTGIAPKTLLFGGIRWVDWSEFEIAPKDYLYLTGFGDPSKGSPVVGYDNDTWTYALGVGREFTDDFSAAISMAYEPKVHGFAANLGPTDGLFSLSLGGTYKIDAWEISAGVTYAWIGDATTTAGSGPAGKFKDNDALGVGFQVAYRF